jgi:predicted AAA+ superfamily ATPase
MQDAFMIEKAVRYDIKGRKYISTPAKYYFEDLGLRNARLNFRQTEQTHLMENLIFNELRLRGYSVDVGQVTYYTKDEQGDLSHGEAEARIIAKDILDKISSNYKVAEEVKKEFKLVNATYKDFCILSLLFRIKSSESFVIKPHEYPVSESKLKW